MSTTTLKLSILDQSPIIEGSTSIQAIKDTQQLVCKAEEFGYHRYWFSEHHGSASFASASPELMVARAAASTSRIRLGTGGILLGSANALQTAERLRLLQVLADGRIDAGFGRAPGGDQRVVKLLNYNPVDAWNTFDEIQQLLNNPSIPTNSRQAIAVPYLVEPPQLWVLGTSVESAKNAGERGLPYVFGSFIDPTHMSNALRTYHTSFVSKNGSAPYTIIALVAFVAETAEKAEQISECSQRWFVDSFLRSKDVVFPLVNSEMPAPEYSSMEQMVVQMRKQTALIGTAEAVADMLEGYKKKFAVDEFMVVTITQDFEDRVKSYELLSEACGLQR
ncbi:MAG: MsnO8 family LLM class oxidoreductase [Ignavibacteria bacterium]|nr:MsnO8 family LLM class oxidoreductase [Ignavibacteria bacterium]